jgi:hypothetical protein
MPEKVPLAARFSVLVKRAVFVVDAGIDSAKKRGSTPIPSRRLLQRSGLIETTAKQASEVEAAARKTDYFPLESHSSDS